MFDFAECEASFILSYKILLCTSCSLVAGDGDVHAITQKRPYVRGSTLLNASVAMLTAMLKVFFNNRSLYIDIKLPERKVEVLQTRYF